MQLGWVPGQAGGYRDQMAVVVKNKRTAQDSLDGRSQAIPAPDRLRRRYAADRADLAGAQSRSETEHSSLSVRMGQPALRDPAPPTTNDPGTHTGPLPGPESGPAGDSPAALAQALTNLYAELDRIHHEAARQLRLTPQQAQLLCMCEHDSPSMGDLARLLNCDNSNITGLVDRVAKQDLIVRSPHQGDRRVTHVALTPRGGKLVQQYRAELRARLGERLANWPPRRRRRLTELTAAAASDLATLRVGGPKGRQDDPRCPETGHIRRLAGEVQ
jgi:DNA-binding MarR family transcriptional regulator